jgi:hypothetical protein
MLYQIFGECLNPVGRAVHIVHLGGVLDGTAALGVVHVGSKGVGLVIDGVRVHARGQ